MAASYTSNPYLNNESQPELAVWIAPYISLIPPREPRQGDTTAHTCVRLLNHKIN